MIDFNQDISKLMALSIRQPWAERIVWEGKDIENRTWPTKFRGWVLIHTGKKPDEGYEATILKNNMPLGGIVGAMEIFGCVTSSESEWFEGPYGFLIRNAMHIDFISCRGKLGFFRPNLQEQNA